MSRLERLRAFCAHAFAVEGAGAEIAPEERELVGRLARFLVRRRLAGPALMALETGRPLNFLAGQFLTFLAPFATWVFSKSEYERFARLLEKRRSVDLLIDAICAEEEREHG